MRVAQDRVAPVREAQVVRVAARAEEFVGVETTICGVKISTMRMEDIPDATLSRYKHLPLFQALEALAPGAVLRMDFENGATAASMQGSLRKIAKLNKRVLSSTGKGATRYLWLESKGTTTK